MTNQQCRWIVIVLALAALASVLGMAAVIMQRQIRLRGALNGLPEADLPARPPILGVNVDLAQYDLAEMTENLDLIAEIGFVWVRQPFNWDAIESQPGAYDWSVYDSVVEETSAHGLRLVAVLGQSPPWAAPHPNAPPTNLDDFAAFAGALAERYGDRIEVYQVWDQPNLTSGWGGQPPSAVAYAALLEATYTAIHTADTHALVLTGGLAPTIETGPDNLSDVLFLRALYDQGAAPFFDGVAAKPYGFDTGPDDRRASDNLLNFSRFYLLRREMERHGDHSKPLWASHFGWFAPPENWQGHPSQWGQTTPDQQAVWTIAAYQRALTEWPWSGALILDNWQPNAPVDDPLWGFALRRSDGSLSPTAEAIRERSELFNTALWPGIYPPTTPLAVYSGEWEFSELGADFGQQGDSVVEVPFVGNTLGVTVRRDNYRAYLFVTIDGEPSRSLPQDERGAYLVLTSPDYKPHIETLPIATNLSADHRHTARIEADRGWDQWALVGFAVGSKIDTTGYDLLATGLAVIGIGSMATALRVGRGLRWRQVLDNTTDRLATRLGDALHFVLSMAAALVVWLGAALTWGGIIPNVVRRIGDGPSLIVTALTAGVFYFSPWLLLTMVALLVLFLLIYAKPSMGLALMMFFTPYVLLPRPLFDRAFSMVEATSLLTLAAWGIHMAAERREKGWPTLPDLWRRMTGLDKAVGLFIAMGFISLSWADLPGVAITDLRQMMLEPCVMYLVLRTWPLTERERWRIVDLLIVAGTIVALVGFYQFATGIDVITAEAGMRRLKSVFGTPNNAALYLVRLIPIAAAIVLIGGEQRRRWLYGVAGVLMTAALGLTLSKGGILLGLPAGLALVAILWAGRAGLIAAGIGIVAEGLMLIPLSRLPRFSGLVDFTSETSTTFFRLQLWQSTLRMLRDHPITGVGLDQFLYQYRGHYILPAAWQQPDLSQPHNFLLNYWVRLGIVGLAAGVWMQIAFWQLAWAAQKRLREVNTAARALTVGLMGSMAAMIAHGMVEEVHFVIDLAFIFFMTLGLMHQLGEERVADGCDDQQADTAAS